MLSYQEVRRGIEIAQALWGASSFGEIPPDDILATILESAHPKPDQHRGDWSGCCC